ncbi:MAG: hypothetical protein SV760_05100, partial [Halobacteria archaeon]|nr:hypothetical protein [Halobacteria archaeon]
MMFEFLRSRVEGVRESLSEAMGSDQEEENETHEIKTDASLEKLRQRNVEGYHDVPDQVGSYEIKVNVPILIRWGNRDSYREVECCLENNRWSIKVDGTAGKKV